MVSLVRKMKNEAGYSVLELTVVMAVLLFIISAAYNLLDVAFLMDRQAEDGFEAQNEGRRVLTEVAKSMRPAENMSTNDVAIITAGDDGTYVDLKVDVTNDNVSDIIRIRLDRTNKQIKLHIDSKDSTSGEFNYQEAGQNYLDYYSVPTNENDYDETIIIAKKIVNAPPSGPNWSAQTIATDPTDDYRLFTFFGENFSEPLHTTQLGAIWVNHVRGVRLYILSDVQPAEIPSPFGIQTDIHFRNLG